MRPARRGRVRAGSGPARAKARARDANARRFPAEARPGRLEFLGVRLIHGEQKRAAPLLDERLGSGLTCDQGRRAAPGFRPPGRFLPGYAVPVIRAGCLCWLFSLVFLAGWRGKAACKHR